MVISARPGQPFRSSPRSAAHSRRSLPSRVVAAAAWRERAAAQANNRAFRPPHFSWRNASIGTGSAQASHSASVMGAPPSLLRRRWLRHLDLEAAALLLLEAIDCGRRHPVDALAARRALGVDLHFHLHAGLAARD